MHPLKLGVRERAVRHRQESRKLVGPVRKELLNRCPLDRAPVAAEEALDGPIDPEDLSVPAHGDNPLRNLFKKLRPKLPL